jgi:dTMP kinase
VRRGRFITLEGGEGTGKSTQVRRLAASLAREGIDALTTREPGGSPGAEAMREVVLSGGAKPFGPFAEALVFAAARLDHLEVTIRPALDAGRWVICDRFSDSTRAYQGILGDVDPDLIRALERITVGETRPDLTIILDLPVTEGLRRARSRGGVPDRFESEGLVFHERLRRAFLAIAEAEPARCVVVDASRSEEQIAADVLQAVMERIGLASGGEPR